MTWRRMTRREARAEALAAYRAQVYRDIEDQEVFREMIRRADDERDAALAACRPILAGMSSAQLLDAVHQALGDHESELPCDYTDVLSAVLLELDRRKAATAHERLRLRNLDRNS